MSLRNAVVEVCVFVVTACAVVGADDAGACECGEDVFVVVGDGRVPAPTNAALWIAQRSGPRRAAAYADVRVSDADGDALALEPPAFVVDDVVDGSHVALAVVRPSAGSWPANTTLHIEAGSSSDVETAAGPAPALGAAPDDVVVSRTSVLRFTEDALGCGHDATFAVDVSSARPLVRSRDGDDVAAPRISGLGGAVGTSLCFAQPDWPDADFGDRARFRFAALDVDGTVTPFGPSIALTLPGDRDCDGASDDDDACPDEPGGFSTGGDETTLGCPSDIAADDVCADDASGCASTPASAAALVLLLLLLLGVRRHALAVVVVVVVVAGAEDAHACSCASGPRATLLAPDAAAVPRNAALLVVDDFDEGGVDGIGVFPADDVSGFGIALSSAQLLDRAGKLYAARPADGLWAENTTFEVRSGDGTRFRFTTTAATEAPDLSAPDVGLGAVVAVVDHSGFFGDSCSDGDRFSMSIGADARPLLRARIDDDSAGGAAPVPTGFGTTLGTQGPCEAVGDWPDATFGATHRFRFAAVAVDGSVGAFTEAVDFTVPDDADCDGISDVNDGCPDVAGARVAATGNDFGGCPDDGPAVNVACPDGSTPGCGGCSTSAAAPLLVALLALVRRRRRR